MSQMDPQAAEPAGLGPGAEYLLAPPPVTAGPPSQPATNGGYGRRLASAVVVAIMLATGGGIGIGFNLARAIGSHTTAQVAIHTVNPATDGTNGSSNIQAIAAKVVPAVVDINTTIETASATARAAGTGLILTSTGDVLTNNHVVEGAISVQVAIQGRPGRFTADVTGVDPGDDLAVIHIENVSGLPVVTLADSSKLHIGDTVLAIGNALGLGGAPRVTQGSITALDQSITASENGAASEQLTGMIRSDASISPGDSGGALANTAGQVVGIITAGEATSFRTTASTVAYAIPSSKAVGIANRILSGQAGGGILIGPVGYLGVGVETLDPETASQLGLSIQAGALVRTVQSGSPAEKAGIIPGSVITAVNSTTIDSSTALGNALHAFKPNDHVTITWVDRGTSRSATVTLVSGPAV